MVHLSQQERKAVEGNRKWIMETAALPGFTVKEAIDHVMRMALGAEVRDGNQTVKTDAMVDRICRMSSDLMQELEKGDSSESFRESIRRNALAMEPEKGYLFVKVMEHMGKQAAKPEQDHLWNETRAERDEETARELIRESMDVAREPGEVPLSQRIDQVVDRMKTKWLESSILQAEAEQIIDAVWESEEALAQAVKQADQRIYSKAEEHAINAAAFYMEVAAGRIAGLGSHITTDGWMLFYMVQEEIWEVYARLGAHEIDKVVADDLLRKILRAFTDLLAQLFIIASTISAMAAVYMLLESFGVIASCAVLLTAVAGFLYLGIMADVIWDILQQADALADEWERSLRSGLAKHKRQAKAKQENKEEAFA